MITAVIARIPSQLYIIPEETSLWRWPTEPSTEEQTVIVIHVTDLEKTWSLDSSSFPHSRSK